MTPVFLEPFKDQLEQHRLDSVRLFATPLVIGEALPIRQSKFLGQPYLPHSKPYPKASDGSPMILLAQINFEEVPALEHYPSKGILQLFVHPTEWYDMEEFKLLFHENTEEAAHTDFSFLRPDLYAESPINCEHKLAFKKETEYGGREDFRFQMDFNGMDYDEFQDTLPKEQQEEMDEFYTSTGHKIGGYAFFTQSDPRGYGPETMDDILLFQIDTDEEIMFGDSGVANVFINKEDLKNRNFDNAYFNWDCC